MKPALQPAWPWRPALCVALSIAALYAQAAQTTEIYGGRSAVIYTPAKLPAAGQRALVVVLHGGLGNAQRIADGRSESALNIDAAADEAGFVVAYLSGTPVARMLSAERLGWNAGDCCGQPAENHVDDVAYIQSTALAVAERYGVDRNRIYGLGHSNGAMMTQRMVCETTLYASAVSISGALETGASSCPAARGKTILALHGREDQNVPINGGKGSKGISRVAYASQASTAQVWKNSGAVYTLQIIEGADHAVDAIDTQIRKTEGQTLGQKIARFFGLLSR
jgi:polyhydroxybutyrate depolymerase